MSVPLPSPAVSGSDHVHQPWSPMTWRTRAAAQQPDWHDVAALDRTVRWLAQQPALVSAQHVATMRQQLAQVVDEHGFIIQIGDCAETFEPVTPTSVSRRLDQFENAATTIRSCVEGPIMRIGRIAGQYAKPRTNATEASPAGPLPVYRGALVNDVHPYPAARRADARRLRRGYEHAAAVLRGIEAVAQPGDIPSQQPQLWTSHEALVLDYEQPQVRFSHDSWFLGSTHFPWVGARTNQPQGAHIEFLRGLANPVAVKVHAGLEVEDLLDICASLDPDRLPGRLSLITRLGADAVGNRLPALVTAVRAAGHPVAWICDPMHGNTTVTSDGRKTRDVATIMTEIREFFAAVTHGRGHPAGVHLEATPQDVTECIGGPEELTESDLSRRYLTTCDPRLNAAQTRHVLDFVAGLLQAR